MVSTRNQEPTFDSSIDAQNKSIRILMKKKKRPGFWEFFGQVCCFLSKRRLRARGRGGVVCGNFGQVACPKGAGGCSFYYAEVRQGRLERYAFL